MESKNKDFEFDHEKLIDIFPCALYVIKDDLIIDCNDAAVEIFGYETKTELIGLRPYELSPEKQPDGSSSIVLGRQILDNLLNNKEEFLFCWIHTRVNGEEFLAKVKLVNKNGIIYALIIDSDEIGLLKHQLNEKNYLNDMLFENHNRVMMLIDPDTGNIRKANQAAYKYYGYPLKKLLNMKIQDINIFSPDQIEEEMLRAGAEQRNYFQFIHRLASGELREVEVCSFPIETPQGKLLFSIIDDVSDKINQKLMFDSLFFDSPFAVAILDKDQKIVNINTNFTDLFQYEFEEAKGKTLGNLLSPAQASSEIDNNIQLIYQGQIVKQEVIRKRKDGSLVEVEALGYPVINHHSIIGVYIIYINISGKKSYEKQLHLFKKILENNSEGVLITDTNGYIEWVNNAFSEITGYSEAETMGMRTNILKSGIHDDSFYQNMWKQLSEKGTWRGEIWNKSKNGDIYSEWLTITSIKDNFQNTTHYVGIFTDLTERKKIHRRMSNLQQKDPLTGLFNRSYFSEMVDRDIQVKDRKPNEFSIIYIDIDGFKEINDSLGHQVGDKLLMEVSRRLLTCMDEDCLLSRFSGDDFVIQCRCCHTEDELKSRAQTLLDKIRQPFVIENTILNVSANIGISRFPKDGIDGETLIRYADIAMYKAKDQIGDKICFFSRKMSNEIEERFLLANYLFNAIANNELKVYYQPIFDIKLPNSIVGAEALLRWESPTMGNVSPGRFIPIAEKTGLIIAIGEWVLEQVCKQITEWLGRDYEIVPVSVNISVKQLEQIGFAQRVIAILDKYKVNSDRIELEITESVSSGELDIIVKNLKRLKKSGIKISMDDFGTGFSSLGQLDIFELDKLKIDKVFIDDLVHISKRQSLVKSIIAMARSLDLTVVAEGIETREQLRYLAELGCQLGQGYLVSKPLPPKEIEMFLERCK